MPNLPAGGIPGERITTHFAVRARPPASSRRGRFPAVPRGQGRNERTGSWGTGALAVNGCAPGTAAMLGREYNGRPGNSGADLPGPAPYIPYAQPAEPAQIQQNPATAPSPDGER